MRYLIDFSDPYIPSWVKWIPYIEPIIVIVLLILVGTALNIFIFRSIIILLEGWVNKIPFVRPIYSGMKQLVSAFGHQEQVPAQEVVLLKHSEFGTYVIGFATGHTLPELAPNKDIVYMNVYIPTTPNPTGGTLLIVEKAKLIPLNISRKEAMTFIMSVGIIRPQMIKKNE